MPLPVFVYAFEANLPQHPLSSWLGRCGPLRLVQTHSMLDHEPTQELRRDQQAAAGSGDDIGDTSRTLPDTFTGERCRPASHTNDDPTAGPQYAVHLGQRTQGVWKVKKGIEREYDVK